MKNLSAIWAKLTELNDTIGIDELELLLIKLNYHIVSRLSILAEPHGYIIGYEILTLDKHNNVSVITIKDTNEDGKIYSDLIETIYS